MVREDLAETEPSADTVVEASELCKRFPPRRSLLGHVVEPAKLAVDRVSLTLSRGEILGLVGPNGAGKTTLIKLLTTLLLPSSGTARIAGMDVVAHEPRIREMVGLVTSNERSFFWRLTGRQNLDFFASLYRLPSREAARWIDELLDALDLNEAASKRFDSYSTGMRQRLAIARGLLSRPQFLFMDEPTKGVDPIGSSELIQIIREGIVERWHPTILITSHNLREIERLCRRIALLNRGRIVATGTLDELRDAAGAADRFRVTVRNLSEARLHEIAGAAQAVEIGGSNGASSTYELDVAFAKGSSGFPRLVRDIVEGGGDVLTCSAVKATFDDVFQRLVAKASAEDERS